MTCNIITISKKQFLVPFALLEGISLVKTRQENNAHVTH